MKIGSMRGQAKDMYFGASHLLFQRARELRQFSTWEQDIIWGQLSGNSMGVKFRRQHPILFPLLIFIPIN
jgi:very-short-patch-repair endonuclease